MIPGAATYLAAAQHFREVMARIPDSAWDEPGLGDWNVRTLAGHTSRALVTVLTYLERPAQNIDVESTAAYYAGLDFTSSPDITARAVAAGEELGPAPLETVDRLLAQLGSVVPVVSDRVIETIAGGMRFSDYLPTRIFELAVHSLDLAAACGVPASLSPEVEMAAMKVAMEIAAARGDGSLLLLALTGRASLPPGFSVV
ncbi:maleylpyruvate isomerase N-terminal domain-containing protein [Crystallibacter degradans]|uniref:maleylpyruvate isomerase N-terminal domain-containing protein n=1 Tax=Crystallibacter degradans TaxID=2726743 RepID=UPI0014749BBD|nr:maleylpyruvate isomerase N-terminal domain-containing protein [Arthrobacter sp. SF27]NMR29756.1 maleylpyruvate isomerase family protein [Arthrobacter sp. SF27]